MLRLMREHRVAVLGELPKSGLVRVAVRLGDETVTIEMPLDGSRIRSVAEA